MWANYRKPLTLYTATTRELIISFHGESEQIPPLSDGIHLELVSASLPNVPIVPMVRSVRPTGQRPIRITADTQTKQCPRARRSVCVCLCMSVCVVCMQYASM